MPRLSASGCGGFVLRHGQLAIAFLLSLLLAGLPAAPAQGAGDCGSGEDAPDERPAGIFLNAPASCSGSLPEDDAADVYTFLVTRSDAVVDIMRTSGQASLCLYEEAGDLVQCAQEDNDGRWQIWRPLPEGTYNIEVEGLGIATSYAFSLAIGPDDCGTGVDAGGSHASATSIALPKSHCHAQVPPSGDAEDWYRFPGAKGQIITATRHPHGYSLMDLEMCLVDPAGTVASCGVHYGDGRLEISHTLPVSGEWRLRLFASGWQGIRYQISVSGSSVAQDDCGTGRDAPADAGLAPILVLPVTCQGMLVGADAADVFSARVGTPGFVNATVGPLSGGTTSVCVLDTQGVPRACGGAVSVPTDDEGLWHLRVTGVGDYALHATGWSASDCNGAGDAPLTPPVTIEAPVTCAGELAAGDGGDAYGIPILDGDSAAFRVELAPGMAVRACLRLSTAQRCAEGSGTLHLLAPPASAGTLVAQITPIAGAGPYTMSVERFGSDDCRSGRDAYGAHVWGQGGVLVWPPLRGACDASFVPGDLADAYEFRLIAGARLTFRATPLDGQTLRVCVLADTMSCTAPSTSAIDVAYTEVAERDHSWRPASTRFIVELQDGGGRYAIETMVDEPTDCAGVEASDTFEDATALSLSTGVTLTCAGRLWHAAGDTDDWYRVELAAGQLLLVHGLQTPAQVCAYRPDGALHGCHVSVSTGASVLGFGLASQDVLAVVADEPGAWRLRVTDGTPWAAYELDVRVV